MDVVGFGVLSVWSLLNLVVCSYPVFVCFYLSVLLISTCKLLHLMKRGHAGHVDPVHVEVQGGASQHAQDHLS